MGIFSLAYWIGSLSEVDDEEAKAFLEEFEGLVEGIDGMGIFTHNTQIALPMFIPGFGIAWGLFSAWSTGFAFSAIMSQIPELASMPMFSSPLGSLAILYMSPFGIMELVAYSLAISRSYILMKIILRKDPSEPSLKHRLIQINRTQPFIKPTIIEIGILVGLLLAGGFLEHYMIVIAQESGLEMPGL